MLQQTQCVCVRAWEWVSNCDIYLKKKTKKTQNIYINIRLRSNKKNSYHLGTSDEDPITYHF